MKKIIVYLSTIVLLLVQGCTNEEFYVNSDEKKDKTYIKVKRENETVILMMSGTVNEKTNFIFKKYSDCIFMDSKNWQCKDEPSPSYTDRIRQNENKIYLYNGIKSYTFVKE